MTIKMKILRNQINSIKVIIVKRFNKNINKYKDFSKIIASNNIQILMFLYNILKKKLEKVLSLIKIEIYQ